MNTPDATRPVVPVDEMLTALDRALEPLRDTTVEGTLTGWKVTRRWGHADLCATEATGDGITHRLPITVPPPVAHTALRRHGPHLASGVTAIVHGHLEIGDRWNPLRLVATRLDITATESDLATRRRQLLERLDTTGDTHRNRDLPMPATIRQIGLVAPAAGTAGRADFLDRLALNPTPIVAFERRVPMSGSTAPTAIAAGLTDLTLDQVDLIVVCRGGGASADLAAFDTAPVADAIVASRVPVLVAVGHAVDTTVADHVAHTSLPTPTAAADWIVARSLATAAASREGALRADTVAATTQAAHARADAERDRARAEKDRRRAHIAVIAAATLALVLVLVLAVQTLR